MKLFFKTVILTSLLAGTLDILSAFTQVYISTHHIFKKMFNYIAGGALGLDKSMNGGSGTVLLGIFFHYSIAFAFTLFYFLIYPKLNIASWNKYVAGLLYGLFAWFVMNLLVLPLSKIPPRIFNVNNAITGALILMLMIGLPISLSANNYFKKVRI